jgi:hypothetical protein
MAKADAAALGGTKRNAAVQTGAAARSSGAATSAAQGEQDCGRRNAAVPASAAEAGSDSEHGGQNRNSGLQTGAAAAAETGQVMEPARGEFEHLLRQQRAYAYDRAGHLDLVSRCVALAGLVAGGAVFTELGASGIGKYLLGIAIPIVAAAEVVFEFAKRAERWREIIRETDALLTKLRAAPGLTDAEVNAMQREYDAIALPREPLFHWARAIAWNVAARERGCPDRLTVDDRRAFFRNIWPGRPDC